jgi:hypothetical protein
MRNDLERTMTPGRLAAQTSHVADMFNADMTEMSPIGSLGVLAEAYADWRKPFTGTVIVLGVTGAQMIDICRLASSREDCMCAIWEDPEYGIKDGSTTHYITLETGGYLFGVGEAFETWRHGWNLDLY